MKGLRPASFTAVATLTGGVLALALATAFLRLDLGDGSYELTVALRYLSGDQPYEDFKFWVWPLSIYLNALLIQVFPVSILTISAAILVSCLVIGGGLTALVFFETRRNGALAALFFFSIMYLGVYHWPRHSYSWNAILFSTLAIVALLRYEAAPRTRSRAWLAMAGVLLGIAIGFKQNIGAIFLVAMLGWFVHRECLDDQPSIGRLLHDAAVVVGGALTVVAGIAGQLRGVGAASWLVETFWDDPRLYTRQGAVSFFSNFLTSVTATRLPKWLLEQLVLVIVSAGSVACALVLVTQWAGGVRAATWASNMQVRIGRDPRSGLWAILFLASFATIFPRADYPHLTFALPLCFAALCILVARLPGAKPGPAFRNVTRRLSVAGCVVLSVVMALEIGKLAAGLVSGEYVVVGEFPARGMLVSRATLEFVHGIRDRLGAEADLKHRVLIAHPYGCFLYPYLGVRNPIAFDYFHAAELRNDDVERMVAQIDRGEIQAMVIERSPTPGTPQAVLRSYAEQNMEWRAQMDGFDLLRRRAPY